MSGGFEHFEWSDRAITRLRELWAVQNPDGKPAHSTREIGETLGCSKNAVVGKAHRLDLPERPSPIGKGNEELGTGTQGPSERRKHRKKKPEDLLIVRATKPKAGAPVPVMSRSTPAAVRATSIVRWQDKVPRIPPTVPAVFMPAPAGMVDHDRCPWVMGEPGRRARRCDAVRAVVERPGGIKRFATYCSAHCALAYQSRAKKEAA